MKVGVLTGGGDCPGLNAVIRAIVRKAERHYQDSVIGFTDGWSGVLSGNFIPLDVNFMRGSLPRGGTVLGTSRMSPRMFEDGLDKVRATIEATKTDALIVIGGEGTLSAAASVQAAGAACVVAVPKTIDNDIALTEQTFGFDTAVSRVMVVEVMGRHVGHIAIWAGIAGGATLTLIPEHPFDIEAVAATIMRRHRRGRWASIVVVAEGAIPVDGNLEMAEQAVDEFGHKKLGGIGQVIASEIEARTGFDTRVTVLGHVQRGGTPTAFDRVLCSRYGIAAIDAVHQKQWGSMVALQGGKMVTVPLADAVAEVKPVSPDLYEAARAFFA